MRIWAAPSLSQRNPPQELRRLPAARRGDTIALDGAIVIGVLANTRIRRIARTLEQELRQHDRETAGVERFATAVITQLTAGFYAIER
jgi:hypothetical protein